ncbi:hypothetical protein MRX96_006011 [Rhipicephalus microplus]
MNVAYNKHRRDVEVTLGMPDEQFGRHFRLCEAVRILPVVGERRGDRSGEAAHSQHLCETCGSSDRQRRDPQQVHSLPENGGREGNRERGISLVPLPGLIGCVAGNLTASRSEQKASFWHRESYFALNVMFIGVADMPILAVYALRLALDYDSHIYQQPQC